MNQIVWFCWDCIGQFFARLEMKVKNVQLPLLLCFTWFWEMSGLWISKTNFSNGFNSLFKTTMATFSRSLLELNSDIPFTTCKKRHSDHSSTVDVHLFVTKCAFLSFTLYIVHWTAFFSKYYSESTCMSILLIFTWLIIVMWAEQRTSN